MMARSPTRSNQRPDTLMRVRICQVDETSCNARPDHTLGQRPTRALGHLNVAFATVADTEIASQRLWNLHRLKCALPLEADESLYAHRVRYGPKSSYGV